MANLVGDNQVLVAIFSPCRYTICCFGRD